MATMPSNYYDLFDSAKRYKRLLYRAGYGLQSRELNEQQDIILHELKTAMGALYADGSLLSGGGCLVEGGAANIQAAVAWVRGVTLAVPASQVAIPDTGLITVGIGVTEEVITENEDASLRDPAVNTRNYNEPGAGRLRITGRWIKESEKADGESFYPSYSFTDGVLQTPDKVAPELEGALALVARYDRAGNGSYVVDGLTVSHAYDDNAEQEHVFSVAEGTGHVNGYEVSFVYAQAARTGFGLDTRDVLAEPHTFNGAGDYDLYNTPVAAINRVIAVKEITENVTHGSYTGCSDLMPHTPVVSIMEVSQGGTTYVEGDDYQVNGNSLDWTPSGSEPAPGSTYTVTYRYQAEVQSEVSITGDRAGINVSGLANGSIFHVDYEYYLARYDRIVLEQGGTFNVVRGVPDDAPVPPQVSGGLTLATIRIMFGQAPVITNDYYRAFRMSDIQALFNRLSDCEFNIAQLSLAEDLRIQDPTTSKLNVFTDPFYDNDMRDLGLTQNAVIDEETLRPEISWQMHVVRTGSRIMLDYAETDALNIGSYTKSRKINEYTWSEASPRPVSLSVSPSIYSWVDRITYSSNPSSNLIVDPNAMLPQINLAVTGGKFAPAEMVDVYFDSHMVATAESDANGDLDVNFTVPSGIIAGTKLVRAEGRSTGNNGECTFTATGNIRVEKDQTEPSTVTPVLQPVFFFSGITEPLAQTFTLAEDCVIPSVSLLIDTPPLSTSYIEVFITKTLVGIPDRSTTIGRSRLYPDQIQSGWVTFHFEPPVRLEAGEEYALTVACLDSTATVRTAQLGEWDLAKGRWMTGQAYDLGVMLSSANQSTWSAIQDEDLTMVLKKAVFEAQKTVTLGTVAVTAATDISLLTLTRTESNTSIKFEAKLLDRNNETHVLTANSRVIIDEYTGNIELTARLTSGNPALSPVISGDIQLAAGSVVFPSTYISRSFTVGGSKLKLYLDVLEPSPSSVSAYYHNGTSWVAMSRGSGTLIGDGWVRMPYSADSLSIGSTRIKLDLTSSDDGKRPAVQNLRAAVV